MRALTYAGLTVAYLLAFALLIAWHPPALGHDWYPVQCCSQQDCQPLPPDAVRMGPDGWEVYTGEVIPYGGRREHISPDGEFHRCSVAYRPNASGDIDRTICLFVPGMGS